VSENDSEIVVQAELPGMTQDDIELNLEDNRLTLRGEKKYEEKKEKENYHSVERSYGRFTRSFTLPAGVEHDKVQATFKDGVLKITMPKSEEAKPKRIAISSGS
jgi:HSP20 family protein